MIIDFKEYEQEMKIVREVMTDEQTQALCGVLVKVVFSSMFGHQPEMTDCKSEKDSAIDFQAEDERSVA